MPKYTIPLFSTWVKNVYSLRIDQGTKGDNLYTDHPLARFIAPTTVDNPPVTPLFVPALAIQFSPSKISQLHLLYRQLYPQSTPPINKKKKERKELNT